MFVEFLWVLLLGSLLGLELIGKVPPTLHTPLMSGANAISGITVLAALTLIIRVSAARTVIPEMALAPLISGVCRVGGTLPMSSRPRRLPRSSTQRNSTNISSLQG